MKRLIIVIIAIVFIVGISVAEIIISTSYLDEVVDKTKEISLTSNEENFYSDENQKRVEELSETWRHHRKLLNTITHSDNLEHIGDNLVLIKSCIQSRNYDDYSIALAYILHYANKYKDIFGIKMQNII